MMKTKFSGILTLLLAFVVQFTFAQDRTISGTVSDESGPLPGVSIIIDGTTRGTETDFDGNYTIMVNTGDVLRYSFVGMTTVKRTVGAENVINVSMVTADNTLDEVVVTALGMKREVKTLSYAAQEIKSEELNLTQDSNVKTALAGKVAGVQIRGQAGSKLGQAGKIRIRGAISLTADADPLYIVDGVPSDPNNVDMENIASINVLKGPNATALYGQRGEFGVVVITTKKGSGRMAVEIISSTTFEKVSYLPNYQNKYGGGYEGEASFGTFDYNDWLHDGYEPEWAALDGARHLVWDNNYADESWGPKFDGKPYAPWYSWFPGTEENPNPYFGKTVPYESSPDNIKDFYNTGVTSKNTIAISGGSDKFNARMAYTYLDQSGITPESSLNKHFVTTNFEFNATDHLKLAANISFNQSKIKGNFDDGYGNQTTGSFNSWFNRNVDTGILKELKDLTTANGYSASWNWWGPEYYAYFNGARNHGFEKPAFWFNPYTFLEKYDQTRRSDNVIGNITATYEINDHWSVSMTGTRNQNDYKYEYFLPFYLSNSASPELYNSWSNSFGKYNTSSYENNYSGMLNYNQKFGKFDIMAFIGGNIRENGYRRLDARMPTGAKTGGLIIPDVYTFSNAGIVPTPQTYEWFKKVNSLYGKASIGFADIIYVDGTLRRDWSSALPADNNGYTYPSVGTSFIFSNLMKGQDWFSFGKLRAGWAQVGNDVGALRISPVYGTGGKPFMGEQVMMNTPTELIDPNIKPALNTSWEAGIDLKFFHNRLGFSFTYYDEKRVDEILPVSIPRGTGYNTYLTNGGETQRNGFEITLDADVIKTSGFNWNLIFNYAQNDTKVNALVGDLTAMTAPGGSTAFGFVFMRHELGDNWGQLRGTGFARDDNGEIIINDNGLYKTQQDVYFGSVLPDFTGGFINTFSYKNWSIAAAIDFQKGGKFFSLTEMWGTYSGLLEETAANNDKGNNVRDAVDDGGGVHVTGVDGSGGAVDTYVEAHAYFSQWYANRLAEPFIHNADYVKLRDLRLTYSLPAKYLNSNNAIKGLSISAVARNIWLISVASDNTHRWDPSELSQTYGENGQVPGTTSYGLNIKLTF